MELIPIYLFLALGLLLSLLSNCFNLKIIDKDTTIFPRDYDRISSDDIFEIMIKGKWVKCMVYESVYNGLTKVKFKLLDYKIDYVMSIYVKNLPILKYRFIGTAGHFHYLLCG